MRCCVQRLQLGTGERGAIGSSCFGPAGSISWHEALAANRQTTQSLRALLSCLEQTESFGCVSLPTSKADLDILPAVVAQLQGWCATLHRLDVAQGPSLVVVQQLGLAAWLQHLQTCNQAACKRL